MPENSFVVRPFEPADQPEIKRLYRETVAANPRLYYRPLSGPQLPDAIAENFAHPSDAFFVAVSEGRIVGFCGLRTVPENRVSAAFVNGTVIPEFRGQGVYRELFRVREAEAVRRGIRTFFAVTSHDNTRMKEFLLRDGFEVYAPENPVSGFWYLRKNAAPMSQA